MTPGSCGFGTVVLDEPYAVDTARRARLGRRGIQPAAMDRSLKLCSREWAKRGAV